VIPLHRLAALFRRSGTLSLHTVLAAVPFLCSGSSSIGSGTFQQGQRHPYGHGTLKNRSRHPQAQMAAPFAYTAATGGKRERTAAREPSRTGLQQESSSQKQDCNKSWTEAAGLRGSTLRLEIQ